MTMVMIMAGGTGGHVMPALAVAERLQSRGFAVRWMGNASGMEAAVAGKAGIALDAIRIKGLRQSGLRRKLAMPFMLLSACLQAWKTIRLRRPDLLLGMGGFVSGPGGLVSKLTGTPLLLHEQNAVAGLTNRYLAKLADRVLSGFPNPVGLKQSEFVGNPVRQDIAAIEPPELRISARTHGFRVLVVGGSQGAQVFNDVLPELLTRSGIDGLEVWHQCGKGRTEAVSLGYRQAGLPTVRVAEFIDDMADAYRWSDVVICRAGAMTVAEISAAGAVALFVPYPYAVSDHQAVNASWLVDAGAAWLVRQPEFITGGFVSRLQSMSVAREELLRMATTARAMSKTDAAEKVAAACAQLSGVEGGDA